MTTRAKGDLATLPPLDAPTAAESANDRNADHLILPDLTQRSDFRMFTASLDLTDQQTAAGAPILHAVGSSTVQDLQGDTMALSALQDMTESPVGLAIFLNHSYTVPEDVAGHLAAAPSIVVQQGIGDLHLDIALNASNPRALDAYKAIQGGTRLGISIGCMIKEALWQTVDGQPVDQDEVSFWDVIEGKVVLNILHVQTLEFSIVGIPANQRSWVQYAAQGLFTRGLASGAADLRLAPLVRAWFPREYERLALSVSDEAQRKQLLDIAPRRGGSGANVLWRPSEKSFALATSGGRTQTVTREKLASLLHAPTEVTRLYAAVPADAPAPAEQPQVTADVTPDVTPDTDPDSEKSATGKTDWPLAERDRAWDNGEVHQRLIDWAGGKDNLDVAKFRSVHFWSPDGDEKSDVSKFKLAFADVIGGDVKAIPRAIFACAGAHGVDAADIPEADKAKVKSKIERYYKRMADEFDDDSIKVPWADDKGDKSASEPDAEKTIGGTGGEIVVKADGSHGAYSGSHTHSHSAFGEQGGDDNHEHEHSHDGDANHHHEHAKAADGVDKTGVKIPATDGEERTVTLSLSAIADARAAERAAMLKTYAEMLAPLGFVVLEASDARLSATAAAAAPTTRKDLVDSDEDAQRVITLVSQIDGCSDELMDLLGIPDADKAPDGDDDDGSEKAMTRLIQRTLRLGLALKDGRRHSAADRESIQAIHDACMSLTNGECCVKAETPAPPDDNADGGSVNPKPGGAGADMDDARAMAETGKALAGVTRQLSALSTALGGLDVKALAAQVADAQQRLDATLAATQAAEARLATMQHQQDALTASTDQMRQQMERLANVPLGRPTSFHARGVAPLNMTGEAPAGVASYTDLLRAATPADASAATSLTAYDAARRDLLTRALAQTDRVYIEGVGPCRHWPEGVGEGVRPPLSPEQRIALAALPDGTGHLVRYTEGSEALIPIVNEGE